MFHSVLFQCFQLHNGQFQEPTNYKFLTAMNSNSATDKSNEANAQVSFRHAWDGGVCKMASSEMARGNLSNPTSQPIGAISRPNTVFPTLAA
jgi:hypothetical protein